MTTLNCYNNALTSLNLAGFTNLTKLLCSGNQLTYLNVSDCTALTDLRCYYNYDLQSINGLLYCNALTYIDCEDCAITSLSGLANLKNLTHIYARNNQLSSFSYSAPDGEERLPLMTLRLSGNKNLTRVECTNTNLSNLNISGCTALNYLDCESNKLTSVALSTLTSLQYFICNDNQLTELDISHCPALELLWCNQNQLTSLDLSNCPDTFYSLDCRYNNIGHALDMSRFAQLWQIACSNNQIPQLTLGSREALTDIWCANNQLTSLDVSNSPVLRYLDAQSNQLTSLNVTGCTALEILYAHRNQLTSLDVSGLTALQALYAQYNNLTSLRVANCPALYMLPMYYNQIKAGQMGKTVSWLPTRSEDNRGTLYVLAGEHPESGRVDGNIMTASQVAQANAKYWDVYCWNWAINDWEPYTGNTFLQGDVNGDGSVGIADVTALIDYLLNGEANAINLAAADIDNDGSVMISDVTALIDYLMAGVDKLNKAQHSGGVEPSIPDVGHKATLELPDELKGRHNRLNSDS
jgi:Leucine-rich repeat (LRR) protein